MIRVVVVEDSVPQRDRLVRALEGDGDIHVVGEAGTATEALALTERLRPDLVTVDLVLPGQGGLSAIQGIMARMPTPILVLSGHITGASSSLAVEALLAGAVEALPKPQPWNGAADQMLRERARLLRGVTVVAHPRGGRVPRGASGGRVPMVAIAASTGGPAALAEILSSLAGLAAPVLVVQHLHPQLVDGFVSWMARISALPVAIARLEVGPEPLTIHRPSADELFASLATHAPRAAIGVLLTGMGDDGAIGLKSLRERGGITIVQDAASSVLDGMPGAARRIGAASEVRPLAEIAGAITAAAARIAA